MNGTSTRDQDYLEDLYRMTTGDTNTQVSMYDVGAGIGLEKSEAGKVAEDLIGEGLVEVKTLSGGIGITALGIEKMQADGLAAPAGTAGLSLGDGPVIDESGREAVAAMVREIQDRISADSAAYEKIEEMVIDLKTLEIQLLSPRPKTDILRGVLRSLQSAIQSTGGSGLSENIGKMIAP